MAAPIHPVVAAAAAGAAGIGPALLQLANESAANTAAIAALAATVAPLPGAVAALTANVAALTATVAPLPGAIATLTANVAALTGAVAALNIPALAAGAAAHAHTCATARSKNAHDQRGVDLAAVPLAGPGALAWPPGFDRAALFEGPVAAVDALLLAYGLPAGAAAGGAFARRNALALHLGTKLC